jgi:hypothetical protein
MQVICFLFLGGWFLWFAVCFFWQLYVVLTEGS